MKYVAAAACAAGVRIVTGDTKVGERGRGDGVYKKNQRVVRRKTSSVRRKS